MKKETYQKIKNLAEKGATEGERQAAREAIKRFQARYGDELPDEVPQGKVYLSYRQKWERSLILRIAEFLELNPFRIKRNGQKNWANGISLEGETVFVSLAENLYDVHRKNIKAKIEWFLAGYFSEALPLSLDDDSTGPPSMSDEEIQVAMAGCMAGRNSRVNLLQIGE